MLKYQHSVEQVAWSDWNDWLKWVYNLNELWVYNLNEIFKFKWTITCWHL